MNFHLVASFASGYVIMDTSSEFSQNLWDLDTTRETLDGINYFARTDAGAGVIRQVERHADPVITLIPYAPRVLESYYK